MITSRARTMRILLILSLTSLLVSIAMSQQVHALDRANVSVAAEATIEAIPDYINIGIEVTKTEKSPSKAKAEVDDIIAQVLTTLRQMNIDDSNVRASQISSNPDYSYENNKRKYVGERVTRNVNVKLYRLDQYSNLVDQILKLDITRYRQNGAGFDNIDEHRNKALVEALDRASAKANVIAKAIDRNIDKVYSVQEAGGSSPMPRMMMAEMASDGMNARKSKAPLEIKPQEIRASVNVIFLLK
ncbi:26 kDa periplasmic immunogenic protein [BD1-7 clade bacterium]|uniref:26 kDa periplasmic immunogenic protein n=1 Tax=BD1-7 clade bacterium TaxID=2029982 RepID=A0A5S9P9E1_9GAMM|nr:26 kDa periplasmic immunogenic protein [BD1-7 clade bacterium]CAA0115770.1 26 kDa periplasmic immunogenic protein [BD1-7 clade bacterium]